MPPWLLPIASSPAGCSDMDSHFKRHFALAETHPQ
jgi:hypothetical protein